MTVVRSIALALATISQIPSLVAAESFKERCLAFQPEKLVKNSTLTHLEYVTSGTTLQFPDNVASCHRPSQEVGTDICRIAMSIPTSYRSGITFELWLPENRNGSRHVSTGNGGIDGCVKYEDLAYLSGLGLPAMGTNGGHNGSTGIDFLHNPDILEDHAYRGLHTGTVSGKLLTTEFYKQPIDHSFYIGCSLGGRMGVKGAEMYPEDYDGVVAGCPAVDFNHLQGQRAMFYAITGGPGSPDYIPIDTWTGLIHDEVLRQCDTIDGAKDGIIEVPERCHFVPETLLCNSWQWPFRKTKDCLNENQINQLRRVYAPYTFFDGSLIFPRMDPGNELKAVDKLLAGQPFQYSVDWFRYVVLKNPNWDPSTYNNSLAALADELNPFNIRTYPKTLPSFKARGGKMISYHGGQDNQITSFSSDRFLTQMAEADPELADYYRLFRISGMFHCGSGPGASVFGQGGGASSEGIPFDAEHSVLAAVIDWVEEGNAPDHLRGTKFVNDTVALGVDFQRDHCLFPTTQTYIGGDPKNPQSWKCLSAAEVEKGPRRGPWNSHWGDHWNAPWGKYWNPPWGHWGSSSGHRHGS